MADDDEVGEGNTFDPTFATAGPRRSTFTPPDGELQQPEGNDAGDGQEAPTVHDDDALADALAADLSRLNTGTFRAVPATPPPFSPPTVQPSPQYPAPPTPARPSAAVPVEPPAAVPAAPVPAAPVPAAAVPDTSDVAAPVAAAPWSSLPAPDPSQAVPLPDPPAWSVRRSLPDEQQFAATEERAAAEPAPAEPAPADPAPAEPAVDEPAAGRSTTLDMIERLQARLELRDREAREVADRERDQRRRESQDDAAPLSGDEPASGGGVSPAAFEPVPDSQLPPPVASAPFIDSASPVSAWPFPQFSDDDPRAPQGEPESAEPGTTAPTDEPAPADLASTTDEPAPADLAPTTDEPETTDIEPAVQPAPWEYPVPAWTPPVPEDQVFDSAVGQQPISLQDPSHQEPMGEPADAAADTESATAETDSASDVAVGREVPDESEETAEVDETATETETRSAEEGDRSAPPLPAWEVPAPGPNWVPAPEFGAEPDTVGPESGAEPDALGQESSAEPDAPGPESGAEPDASGAGPSAVDETPTPVDPSTSLDSEPNPPLDSSVSPSPEELAPSPADRAAAWEPQPWDLPSPRDADVVPQAAQNSPWQVVLPPMPESLVPIFSEPQPEAGTPEVAEPVYTPPPLIEPIQHGPPVLPSQASGRPPLISPSFGMPPTEPPVDSIPTPGASPREEQYAALLEGDAPDGDEADGIAPDGDEPDGPEPDDDGPDGDEPDDPEPDDPEPADPQPVTGTDFTPPPLVEPTVAEHSWEPPTGEPMAPPAGDTLDGPTLDASTVADAVAAAAASTPPPREFSFDDLLADDGQDDEEPQVYRDPEPSTAEDSAPEAIFIEPMPVAAGEAVPTDTGSISVIDQAYEEELPDDVDETDRAVPLLGAVSVDPAGVAVLGGAIHPPSGPIATVRVPEHEVVIANGEPVRMRVFSLEEGGLEPTPVDHRVGRAARLFWLWFASNSSIVSLGLGASVFALGMSLRQSVVSVLAGVALSFVPLGLTTLAGKRSGQPTMVVSRATFGLLGNILPAILALVTRVFWGAVLLWLLASSFAIILVGAGLDGGLGDRQLLLISLAIGFLIALLVAFAGYPLFARIQLILSVISAILVVGLIAITWKYVDFSAALTTPDGSWALTIGGAVLVFSFVGLVWANSGADLARYQRPTTSGAASMLWATVGTTLPTFILIAYGALLAASDKGVAAGFLGSPLDTLSLMLPSWYPIPLLAATGLSLLSGIILTLYSGGFALQAIGVRVRRQWSIVIVGVLLGALALLLTFGVTGGMNELFRDAATTLAVPTAAWAGIFAAEMMVRNRRFASQSLLTRGGVYADVRWLNLIALVVISVIGYGLTTASITWLSWQGYVFTLLGMPLKSDLAASDVGVLVALVLGLLVPLIAGVPAIRRQEAERATI